MRRNELKNHPTMVMDWAIAKDRRLAMLRRRATFATSARIRDMELIAMSL